MSKLMLGSEVTSEIKTDLLKKINKCQQAGINPKMVLIRVGNRADDIAYEKSAFKRMDGLGIICEFCALPEDVNQSCFEDTLLKYNNDDNVHGIMLFRPLPNHLNEKRIAGLINPDKDVDCVNPLNFAKVFMNDDTGYAPCTPEAVMAMLKHYQIDLSGKNITVVGRSLVVGKPLAMLLLAQNATVTITHTKTRDLADKCLNADIIIAAAGKAKMIGEPMVAPGSIVLDVGINFDQAGKMCGDVDFEQVKDKCAYLSPVPRGVGSVTSFILCTHVVKSALKQLPNQNEEN